MTIILDKKEKALRELAFVVDSTNSVENLLKVIVARYLGLQGAQEEIFTRVFLHNSVMGLGQKFKVLQHIIAIEGWPVLDAAHFHTVLKIRNSFAHAETDSISFQVELREDGSHTSSEAYQVVDSLGSSGRYEEIKRSEALERFNISIDALHDYLLLLDTNHSRRAPD